MILRRLVILALIGAATSVAPSLAAAPRLEIDGPSELSVAERGTLRLTSLRGIPRRLLRLTTTAGTLGEPTRSADGSLNVPFTPPQVARPTTVTIRAAVGRQSPQVLQLVVVPERHDVVEQATDGPLDLRLPRAAVIGEDDALTVSLRAQDPEDVRLVASVGTIDAPELIDGRLRATYRPPAERFPQMAVIVALDRSGALDWGAIQLVGRPTVETDTTPGASVTVEVASRRFGPVVADAAGRASIAVLVPPGVSTASVHAVDPAGATTNEPLDLKTPQPSSLTTVCNIGNVAVVALDAGGAPLPDAPHVSASGGDLGARQLVAPGVHRVAFRTPQGRRRARLTIVAEHGDQRSTCDVVRDAIPPPDAPAAAPTRRWLGLGLQGGVHTNFGAIVAPLVTAQVTARLPVLDEGLLVGASGGFLMHRSEGADRLRGEDVAMTLIGGPLTARVAYELPVPTVVPYVLVHGGVFVMTSRLSSPTAGAMTTTQAVPAVGAALGAWTALGPGQVVLEAGYTYAELDNDLVDGALGGLGVTGGYRVEL